MKKRKLGKIKHKRKREENKKIIGLRPEDYYG